MNKLFGLILAVCLVLTATVTAEEYKVDYGILNEDQLMNASAIIEEALNSKNELEDPDNLLTDEEEEALRAEYMMYIGCGRIGFDIRDLDGDGNPELIICTLNPEDSFFGKLVLALYAGDEEGFTQVFASGERDRYYYAGGCLFANQGANSAFDSVDTTLEYAGGELKDLGYATDEAQYVQYPMLEAL